MNQSHLRAVGLFAHVASSLSIKIDQTKTSRPDGLGSFGVINSQEMALFCSLLSPDVS